MEFKENLDIFNIDNKKPSADDPARRLSAGKLVDESRKNYFSLFPDNKEFKKLFPQSFIMHRPKSSVGGDGYWIHQGDGCTYLVVFDCVGDGHLASIMTRVYAEVTEKVIVARGYDFPNRLLADIHQRIKNKFENKKGMLLATGADFGIVKINHALKELEYSGAKMNLYQVADGELIITKADKMNVGDHFEFAHEYKTNIIDLKKKEGSTFYLLSDGIKDLVGGPSNRKLGSGRLKEILEDASKLPIEKQKKHIADNLTNWKGANQITNDQMLIGFRI